MTREDYSYSEVPDDLRKRIDAHKKFSDFSLEEFFEQEFEFYGKKVLDLGCGDGNFAGIFSSGADRYLGIDKNSQLIERAAYKFRQSPNIDFVVSDIDAEFPGDEDCWDIIFLVFSSYYSNDSKELFRRCAASLTTGGEVVVIGPGPANAKEIDDYCSRLFGREASSSKRAGRISKEFAPIVGEIFGTHSVQLVNFDLHFPSYLEYFEYLSSTLQYRESFAGELDQEKSRRILEKDYALKLTKEVECLRAKV